VNDCPTCPRDGRINHTENWVCDRCATRSGDAIVELPILYVSLHGALAGGSPDNGPRVDYTPDPRVPLSMAAWTALENLARWTIDAETTIRSELNLSTAPSIERTSVAFSRAVLTLRRNWSQITCKQVGVDLVFGAFRQRGRAYRTLGWDTLIHALPAPCPQCNLMTLIRYDGDDQVSCTACKNVWPEQDYTRLTIILADDARRRALAP